MVIKLDLKMAEVCLVFHTIPLKIGALGKSIRLNTIKSLNKGLNAEWPGKQ